MILLLHDVCDVLMEAAKMCKYCKQEVHIQTLDALLLLSPPYCAVLALTSHPLPPPHIQSHHRCLAVYCAGDICILRPFVSRCAVLELDHLRAVHADVDRDAPRLLPHLGHLVHQASASWLQSV